MSCTNNYYDQPIQITLGGPCISQILTNDPNVLIDFKINIGSHGINFQSNMPIIIDVQFNCSIRIMYMCITGSPTNVEAFSYNLQDNYNNSVASGFVNSVQPNQCVPRPLNIESFPTRLIITILQTNDEQPPRNVILDLQGCYPPRLS